MRIGRNQLFAIIGLGTMGNGIAATAALARHRATIIDGNADALLKSREILASTMAGQVKRGLISPDAADHAQALASWSTDLAACRGSALAI